MRRILSRAAALSLALLLGLSPRVGQAHRLPTLLPAATMVAEPLTLSTTLVAGSGFNPIALVGMGGIVAAGFAIEALKDVFGHDERAVQVAWEKYQAQETNRARAWQTAYDQHATGTGTPAALQALQQQLEAEMQAEQESANILEHRLSTALQTTEALAAALATVPSQPAGATDADADLATHRADHARHMALAEAAKARLLAATSIPNTEPADRADAARLAGAPGYGLSTATDHGAYAALVDAGQVLQAQRQHLHAEGRESTIWLLCTEVADRLVHLADDAYVQGQDPAGASLLYQARTLMDDTFNAQTLHALSQDSLNFLLGVLAGATGAPVKPAPSAQPTFARGQAVGAVLGLLGDAALGLGSLTLEVGGGALTFATGGFAAPVLAGTTAEAAAGLSAATAGAATHGNQLWTAMDKLELSAQNTRVPSPKEMARLVGGKGDSFHRKVKDEIIKDAKPGLSKGDLHKLGTNPDVSLTRSGRIGLRSRNSRFEVLTNLNINMYGT